MLLLGLSIPEKKRSGIYPDPYNYIAKANADVSVLDLRSHHELISVY